MSEKIPEVDFNYSKFEEVIRENDDLLDKMRKHLEDAVKSIEEIDEIIKRLLISGYKDDDKLVISYVELRNKEEVFIEDYKKTIDELEVSNQSLRVSFDNFTEVLKSIEGPVV